MENEVLDAVEAAKFLKVSRDTLYGLARRRLVPHKRLGRQIRFHRKVLEEFIRNGTEPADFTFRDS